MTPPKQLTIDDYIRIVQRRWRLIAGFAVLGCALGFFATKMLPKRFTSETLVLVEQPVITTGPRVVSQDTNERFASMQQQIMSKSRLEPIIRQSNLYGEDISKVPMEQLVVRLQKAIKVTPIAPMAETRANGLPGFTIGVTLDNALTAQAICSTITSMFMESNIKIQQAKTKLATDFLDTQVDEAKAKLDEHDARMAAFQRMHLGSLPDDRNTNVNVLAGLAAQMDAATQALSRAQQDKTFAQSSLEQQLAAWQATLSGRNPEASGQQVAALEAQLAALKSKYTDDHPDVVKLKRDLAAAKRLADANDSAITTEKPTKPAAEPPQIQALRAQIHQYEVTIQERSTQQEEIRRRIATYQARIESTPEIEQQYKELTRDHEAAVENYNELSKQRDQARMQSALQDQQQGEQFRVLDAANLPDKPSFPDPFKFGFGGLAGGLGCAAGLIFLIEMRDTSVRSDKDVEALIHVPVLAMVPAMTSLTPKSKAGALWRG